MGAIKVQSLKGNSAGSTFAFPSTSFTAGNSLLCFGAAFNGNGAVSIAETTHSRSFTKIGEVNANSALVNAFLLENITGGSTVVTATTTGTVILMEYSGLLTASSFDKTITNSGVASTSHASGTTATTTAAVELIIFVDSYNGSGTAAATTMTNSFTRLSGANDAENNASSFWPLTIGTRESVATGTFSTALTWVSNPYANVIVTIKEIVAAGSDIPTPLSGIRFNTLIRM